MEADPVGGGEAEHLGIVEALEARDGQRDERAHPVARPPRGVRRKRRAQVGRRRRHQHARRRRVALGLHRREHERLARAAVGAVEPSKVGVPHAYPLHDWRGERARAVGRLAVQHDGGHRQVGVCPHAEGADDGAAPVADVAAEQRVHNPRAQAHRVGSSRRLREREAEVAVRLPHAAHAELDVVHVYPQHAHAARLTLRAYAHQPVAHVRRGCPRERHQVLCRRGARDGGHRERGEQLAAVAIMAAARRGAQPGGEVARERLWAHGAVAEGRHVERQARAVGIWPVASSHAYRR